MENRGIFIVCGLMGIFALVLIGLGNALLPLLAAVGMAYFFFPLIDKVEKLGVKRHYTMVALFLVLAISVLAIMLSLIPALWREALSFLQELPQSTSRLLERIEILAGDFGYELQINNETVKVFVAEHTTEISSTLIKGVTSGFNGVFTSGLRWLLAIMNLFLIPLFFFYVVNDYEKLAQGVKSFIPPYYRPKLKRYLNMADSVLNGYIRGQLLVAAILSLLYGIGLALVGLRFGFIIGFLAGLLSVIPYVGFTFGFVTSLVLGLANFHGVGELLGILAVFAVVQTLEGTVITPKLVGNKVGLSALATILSLMIGGNLFGLVGMLVAIPVAGTIKIILTDLKNEYIKLEFYNR